MKLLVTGATGFVGSHLLVELLQSGHEVIAVRRPGSEPVISMDQNPNWLERPILELTNEDMRGVEVVIHLASAGVSPQQASWQELEEINVKAGLKLIELTHQAGGRRFVAAGTCLEYGVEASNWERIPPAAPLRPTTPYGTSKAAGFLMLEGYASINSIEMFYGRIFTAYGDGQFNSNLWPSLRQAALTGKDFPMTLGFQTRDFIHVTKVAEHLRIAAERSDMQSSKPMVVNIGSGKGMRVVDFAMQQWENFGATGKLKPGTAPNRLEESARIVADITNLVPRCERD